MLRVLPFSAVLAACTPSPQEAAMRSTSLIPQTTAPSSTGRGTGDHEQAAQGPIPEPVSAAGNSAPAPPADVPADLPPQAQGRRTLSTAFVRVGPDGHLTVERRDGHVLVLRDVIMRPKDYCGVQVIGAAAGVRYCGGYAEVAAARPGGMPAPEEPDLAISNPLDPPRSPAKPD